jgi:hypothetical protein
MSTRPGYRQTPMTYAPVNGLQLYYETRGTGRPLVLLPGTTHVGVTRRPREVFALIMPFLDER